MKNVNISSQNEYTLLESVGTGSMSEVFKALRKDSRGKFEETVALKVFYSEEKLETWKREYQSLSRVNSPNCVRVLSFEWIEDKPALCLEYVEGDSLAAIVERTPLSEVLLLEIAAQTVKGLSDLWGMDLFHGDLSPRNIMVDVMGRIRLLDFGLGNFEGEVKYGTPMFIHPSLTDGGAPSRSTDIYALGKVLHWITQQRVGGENVLSDLVGELCSDVSSVQEKAVSKLESIITSREELATIVKEHMQSKSEQLNQTQEFMVKVASVPYSGQELHDKSFHQPKNPRRRIGVAILFAALSTIVFVVVRNFKLPEPAIKDSFVQIRTSEWKQIWIDGKSVGYTPINPHALVPGVHRIKWVGKSSSGEISLTVKKGETKLLTDEDFEPGE